VCVKLLLLCRIEDETAAFMGTQASIAYSDSATTTSSCIPAFAKKGDLILADRGVEEPVQTGLDLSRATVRYFKHNDMADLERLLLEVYHIALHAEFKM
jgi:serine palmitoyltransferase